MKRFIHALLACLYLLACLTPSAAHAHEEELPWETHNHMEAEA